MIFKKQNPPDKAKELYQAGFDIGGVPSGLFTKDKKFNIR